MPAEQIRQEAHTLIDTMPSYQVATVVGLLQSMLDPVSRALANAPFDDEPESEAERLEMAEQDQWLADHPEDTVDHADVLADFGLSTTMEPLVRTSHGMQQVDLNSSRADDQAIALR